MLAMLVLVLDKGGALYMAGSKRIPRGMCGRAPDPARGMLRARHSSTIGLVGFVKQ